MKLMKKSLIIFIFLAFAIAVSAQESKKVNNNKLLKSATVTTGISLPMGDFAETGTEIGPAGNAKPGFFLAGSVDLLRGYFGWRFEANTAFNPIETNQLAIMESSPEAETGTWTNTKLLTGLLINLGSEQLNVTIGVMLGGMWLYYPAFTAEKDDPSTLMKIQNINSGNFALQYHAALSYSITEKIALGLTLKYEHTKAEAQYLQTLEKYQLGNAFNLENEPHRISNELPSGESYTGWTGYGRSEHTISQKVTELKIGIGVQFRL
jgi:hypothetical protein